MRTSQKQWNDIALYNNRWYYWPPNTTAPEAGPFDSLLDVLNWPQLPVRRLRWLYPGCTSRETLVPRPQPLPIYLPTSPQSSTP